jgi:hypothetical protein
LLSNSQTTPGRVTLFDSNKQRHRSILGPVPSDQADIHAWMKTACGTFVSSIRDGNAAASTVLGRCPIAARGRVHEKGA